MNPNSVCEKKVLPKQTGNIEEKTQCCGSDPALLCSGVSGSTKPDGSWLFKSPRPPGFCSCFFDAPPDRAAMKQRPAAKHANSSGQVEPQSTVSKLWCGSKAAGRLGWCDVRSSICSGFSPSVHSSPHAPATWGCSDANIHVHFMVLSFSTCLCVSIHLFHRVKQVFIPVKQ